MYAVVATGGKQYRVSEGDSIKVELLPGDPGAQLELNQVLFDRRPGVGPRWPPAPVGCQGLRPDRPP